MSNNGNKDDTANWFADALKDEAWNSTAYVTHPATLFNNNNQHQHNQQRLMETPPGQLEANYDDPKPQSHNTQKLGTWGLNPPPSTGSSMCVD